MSFMRLYYYSQMIIIIEPVNKRKQFNAKTQKTQMCPVRTDHQ